MTTWDNFKKELTYYTDTERDYVESVARLHTKIISTMKDKGITQRELAEMTGIPQPSISRFFDIKTTPRLDKLHKIAFALGLSITLGENKMDAEEAMRVLRQALKLDGSE